MIKRDAYIPTILDKYDQQKFIAEEETFIRAVGGDGTLLNAIRFAKGRKKPFYGIAKGTVNFLMNPTRSKSIHSISQNPSSKATKVSLNLIKVRLDLDGTWKDFEAFNEVYIGAFNGWIDFNATHEDAIIGSTKGAGLIFSTSQGSTAINRNSGGVILPLSSWNWSVTTVQCNRNFNYILEPKPIVLECSSRNEFYLCIDGQIVHTDKAIRVKIIQGSSVDLIFDDYADFKRKRR